jgi:hypothetical protein
MGCRLNERVESTMTQRLEKRTLSHRELVLLRRAAEDAIDAANPRYAPFIDAMANPLKVLVLVDMAMRSLDDAKITSNIEE